MTGLLIVVPARGGSERTPGKNLRPLAGRGLLAWTAAAIAEADLDAPVILTTDDPAIAKAGQALGFEAPFLRPAALATATASMVTAVVHALDWWAEHHCGDPELLMLLQPTSPFRGGALLRDGMTAMMRHSEAEAVVAVTPVPVATCHLYRMKESLLMPLAPRPGETCLRPTGALYLIRAAAFRKHESFFPPRTLPLTHEGVGVLDIDTESDWQIAEALAAHPSVS